MNSAERVGTLDGALDRVLLDEETIQSRVAELAREISSTYSGGTELVAVAILNGAYIFASDLVRRITVPTYLDFVSISRYKVDSLLREVRITQDIRVGLAGKPLLLIEDIVDTGLTLNFLTQIFRKRNPSSIAVCSLLDRPGLRLAEIPMKFVGFHVQEEFLVGYGLDYRDEYRELPYIAALDL